MLVRAGAAVFQALLLDHDPAVNWANWSYMAGTGNDPRNRRFKTVTQYVWHTHPVAR